MRSLLDDPDSTCIIRECRELEAPFETNFTDQILGDAGSLYVRDIKKHILEKDKKMTLATRNTKAPLIADVSGQGGVWPAVWDSARHLGSRHMASLQSLTHILAHHGRGSSPCPQCDTDLSNTTLIDHVLQSHKAMTKLSGLDKESVISKIANRDITFVYRFHLFFAN